MTRAMADSTPSWVRPTSFSAEVAKAVPPLFQRTGKVIDRNRAACTGPTRAPRLRAEPSNSPPAHPPEPTLATILSADRAAPSRVAGKPVSVQSPHTARFTGAPAR